MYNIKTQSQKTMFRVAWRQQKDNEKTLNMNFSTITDMTKYSLGILKLKINFLLGLYSIPSFIFISEFD